MKKLLILSAALLLAGCASKNVLELSEVAEISPNRYMLAGNYSVLNDSGFLVNDLIKHGTDFCQKEAKFSILLKRKLLTGKPKSYWDRVLGFREEEPALRLLLNADKVDDVLR